MVSHLIMQKVALMLDAFDICRYYIERERVVHYSSRSIAYLRASLYRISVSQVLIRVRGAYAFMLIHYSTILYTMFSIPLPYV